MSEQAARDAVIRMATDPEFREGVRGNDPAVFAGLDLSQQEIAQLRSLSSDDSGAGVEQLAARLSKSSLGGFFSSSLASLHGGDGSHDAAGSYTPEQHSAASAPVPLTEHASAPVPLTEHVSVPAGQDNPTNAVPQTDGAQYPTGGGFWHEGGDKYPTGGGHDPDASYAPPGGGNDETSAGSGYDQPVETQMPLHEGGETGWAGTPFPVSSHEGGFTGGVLPSGAGEAHSLLNHPTDGGPAAQGAPAHHGAAGYDKPDKPDGGPKPPKLDALISDHAVNPNAAQHSDASYQPDKPPDGGPPPKLDGLNAHQDPYPSGPDHVQSHSDAGYEKPDKPDGGPKPPKLDALISDSANVEGAHEQAGQSGYYGGQTNPVAEG